MSSPSTDTMEEERLKSAYSRRTPNDFRYSFFNFGNLFTVQERERAILKSLKKALKEPLSDQKILEVGCGSGVVLLDFVRWGARADNLTGLDLLPHSIAQAKERLPSAVHLLCQNISTLPFSNDEFDLVVQSTVFSSILDQATRQRAAAEMLRVLKRGGCILWNPNNPDVRGMKKNEIEVLFPNCEITIRRVTLAPPLTRRLGYFLSTLLAYFPFLRTHYVAIIRKVPSA